MDRYIFDEADLEKAEFIEFLPSKETTNVDIYSTIVDSIAFTSHVPTKFKYIYTQDSITLVTQRVGDFLKSNGIVVALLPLKQLKKLPRTSEDAIKGKLIEGVYALGAPLQLHAIAYSDGMRVYERQSKENLSPFDLASVTTTPLMPSVCSQRFYQLWKKNFGDIKWRKPIRLV